MSQDGNGRTPWPTDIEVDRAAKTLAIAFDDGRRFVFSAEFLRVHSPSAEVQGHSPEDRKTVPGKAGVGIVGLEEVGTYAVRIIFDDLHDSGLYTWADLRRLGVEQEALWAAYLCDLREQGLSRDP
jgi:DUF971 family protein